MRLSSGDNNSLRKGLGDAGSEAASVKRISRFTARSHICKATSRPGWPKVPRCHWPCQKTKRDQTTPYSMMLYADAWNVEACYRSSELECKVFRDGELLRAFKLVHGQLRSWDWPTNIHSKVAPVVGMPRFDVHFAISCRFPATCVDLGSSLRFLEIALGRVAAAVHATLHTELCLPRVGIMQAV